MKVFYDTETKSWFHTDKQRVLTIGANKWPIEYKDASFVTQQNHRISLLCRDGNAGPIIGILTSKKDSLPISGNIKLFKDLQETAVTNGGVTVVFTPEHIRKNTIKGFLYLPEENKWTHVLAPLPHVVYNRIPFRKKEKSSEFHNASLFFKNRNIPFFNPCFINKYEMYQILSMDEKLKPFLPDTMPVEENELKNFLYEKNGLYLKPVQASKGRGIARIRLGKDSSIEYAYKTELSTYKSFEDFWNDCKELFSTKEYIAQEEITPKLYNGKRYDFRILAHQHNNQYQVTGIGVRCSNQDQLTTHVPNGGFILPYTEVQSKKHDLFIEKVTSLCGKALSQELGYFGEFSIDAGVTNDGKYIIYEINSKPMSFDENEIEEERIKALYKLFIELSHF